MTRRFTAVRIALLLIAAAGCTRWQRMPALPAPEQAPPRTARVTPATGTMVVLRDVQLTADSVIGWYRPTDPSGLLSGPRTRFAVQRDQVVAWEQPVPDALATAGGVVIAVVVGYTLLALFHLGTGGV